MVCASMAERELEGLVAGREREQLMAEADAEDRDTAEQFAHDGDLLHEGLRIAGAVREQHPVEAIELVAGRVVREHGHRGTGAGEPPEDRALAAVVDDRDPGASRVRVDVRLRRRHDACESPAAHRRLPTRHRDRLLDRPLAGEDDRTLCSGLAQLQHERARVDAGQGDEPALVQPVGPGRTARLPHQDRPRVRSRRLRPPLRDAVIADHRRGEAHELLREARVGDDLLVTGHRGREHRLTNCEAVRPDRLATEDGAVLERDETRHAENTTRPAAIVVRTAPLTVSPSSHELTERERNVSSVMRWLAFRSSRTRLAVLPTATRGSSSPYARAGPADIRS